MNDPDPFLLPKCDYSVETATTSSTALSQNVVVKKKRFGKGTNIITTVRKLFAESENWLNKKQLSFSRCANKSLLSTLFYVESISDLEQSSEDPHFIWKDIQLSKGQLNRDRLM